MKTCAAHGILYLMTNPELPIGEMITGIARRQGEFGEEGLFKEDRV